MKRRVMIGLALLIGVGIVAGANAHLLWMAVRSQPDCVPHLEAPGQNGQFRAARSSC